MQSQSDLHPPTPAPAPAHESIAPVVPLMRLEGGVLFAAAVALYLWTGAHWGWFLGLLLAPDLSALGYLAGPRAGARCYNAAHVTIGPALLAAIGFAGDAHWALAGAAIWAAHVGMDRALGYGLKLPSAFRSTHLGRIGATGRQR